MNALYSIPVKALYPYWKNRLTVLMYHRVERIVGDSFDQYGPTISATPEQFASQMAFVRDHFHPISLGHLGRWLHGEAALPSRPLLITFDDGYRDNFDVAFPILKRHGLTGAFFLATDYIGSGQPFDWDLTAYCFHHTRKREVWLPMTGQQQWNDSVEKEEVMNGWIRLMLQQPDRLRREAVAELVSALEVRLRPDTFEALCLNWDQVRSLAAAGMDLGSHTSSHMILDRLKPAQARQEMLASRQAIERHTGLSASAFAYPNGVFNPALEALTKEAGYDVAFSTRQGPSPLSAVSSRPLAIERIAISRKDDMARFIAKLAGLPRLKQRI